MTQHYLSGREASELLWFQRRQTLQAAAAWVAAGGWTAAVAQQRSNIVELEGDTLVNGSTVRPDTTIQSGDVIETGPKARLVFVIGNSSF
ncbi:MAG: iron dicitrate transport regulator FecR, partial [Burkholderiaceae bacterium]